MAPDPKDSGLPGGPATHAAQQDEAEREGKGKGKGVATEDNAEDTREQLGGDSVISRLGRSATGLSKSVLKGAPATDGLANLASSGKSGTTSMNGQPGTWAESSFAAPASGSAGGGGGGGGSGAFRSTHMNAHIAAEEEAFSNFLDNTSVLAQTEPIGFGEPLHDAAATAPEPASQGLARNAGSSSVAEQQERDGVEVVRLLSQADEESLPYEGDVTISKSELESLRRALFESGTAQLSATDWNNMLNFVPDFLRDDRGSTESLESSYMQLGVVDSSQAGQLWLEEWNRVLTGYTDEVWGDLGDLVQEARSEVEQIRERQVAEPRPDPRALRRLRTILTRVRARL